MRTADVGIRGIKNMYRKRTLNGALVNVLVQLVLDFCRPRIEQVSTTPSTKTKRSRHISVH